VGDATDPRDAARAILAAHADVAFVDVEMPGVSGLAVAGGLPVPPWIVFVTAHTRYALDAFGVSAIDYLVKPVREADLARALDKAEKVAARGAPEVDPSRTASPPNRIATRAGAKHIVLDVARVTHFRADSKGTLAFADGEALDVDATLGALEARLGPGFVRIHRAILVNLAWIREVDARSAAGACVRLSDAKATELSVARDRIRALKDRLGI
jgi:DNA-binding LytR/AlgR family response regulator